jgi:hypothetical protein
VPPCDAGVHDRQSPYKRRAGKVSTFTAIAAAGVSVAPVILHYRKSFVSRFHEGLTALDIDPRGKAADETRAFLLWVCDQVTLLPNKRVTEVATWPVNASR